MPMHVYELIIRMAKNVEVTILLTGNMRKLQSSTVSNYYQLLRYRICQILVNGKYENENKWGKCHGDCTPMPL